MPSRRSTTERPASGQATATPKVPKSTVLGERTSASLYKGHERLSLIRDLALGEFSHRELGTRAGLPTADIADFAKEYADEISEVRAALAGQLAIETAGLWITKKQNRLAEYQAEIEEIRDYLATLRNDNVRWSRTHKDLLKVYMDLFRQTADELGAYPQRSAAPARQGQTVHYIIETDHTGSLT